MKVIIGCERSQEVCLAFRAKGHEAYSCDLQECAGDHPEWHFQDDIFEVLKRFKPKLGIFHPPCTFLTVTANKWLNDQPERASGKLVGEARREARREAIEFFMKLWNYDIEHICIENPVGNINSILPPTQIIQPYYFGDEAQKTTCLWLKNLPPLFHAKQVDLFNSEITHVCKGEMVEFKSGKRMAKWYVDASKESSNDRTNIRSKTFSGIAKAMAEQWNFQQ